jgi:hypothetical protein
MLIELGQPARILGDEHRLERALPIARNGKRDRAVLRQHRLRRCPVAMIRLLGRLGLPAAVAQVVRELAGQGALHEHLLHLAEQVIQLRHRLPAAEQRIDGIGVERDRRAEWRGSGVTGFRRARLSWSGHPDLLSQSMPSHTEFRIGPGFDLSRFGGSITGLASLLSPAGAVLVHGRSRAACTQVPLDHHAHRPRSSLRRQPRRLDLCIR